MPDISIVIKATDRYSDAIKTMSDSNKVFSKDMDGMQTKLNALSKTKATLQVDVKKAKEELTAAQKQFAATGEGIDELEKKQLTFEEARRNLALVTKEAANVEKQMTKTGDAFSKLDNNAGAGGKLGSALSTLAQAGGIKMIGDAASQWANTLITSAGGSDAGTLFSSLLSGATSGAAMGSLAGPIGTAVGAAIGGAVGLVSGGSQIFEQQDEAYKNWYAGLYENAGGVTDTSLTTGSATAGSREQIQVAFAQRFGSEEAANEYLDQVKEMAVKTNYTYDEITGYTKLLLNSYGSDKTLGVLQSLSDATAGLNLDSSDINQMISGLSRLRLSETANSTYLNYFRNRGVDTDQALADYLGVDKSKVADMEISGTDAAQAILDYIDATYGGLSDKLAATYDALVDNLGDVQADIDAAMGEGYNEVRGQTIAAQIETYGGELGEALQAANKAIGAGRAALDNLADQYTEEALAAVLTGKETTLEWSDKTSTRLQELAELYQEAMADYNAGNAEAGTLVETYLEEARALAEAQYDSSDAVRAQTDAENDMIAAIRENTSALTGWKASYETSQNLTKGLAANLVIGQTQITPEQAAKEAERLQTLKDLGLYAVGIDYVPYDNFPALLHQGERVQTAVEARSERSAPTITITGNTFTIREDADVQRVASEILTQLELAGQRG